MKGRAALLLVVVVGCAALAGAAAQGSSGTAGSGHTPDKQQQAHQQEQQQQQPAQPRRPPPQQAAAEATDALGRGGGDSETYESIAFGDIIEGAAVAAATAAADGGAAATAPNDAQRPMQARSVPQQGARTAAAAAAAPAHKCSSKADGGIKPAAKSGGGGSNKDKKGDDDDEGDLQSCPLWPPKAKGQAVTAAGRPVPSRPNVFSELTVDEYNAVLSFLYSNKKLGLEDIVSIDGENRTMTVSNYIHSIHMEMPPKHEVLAHLDHKGPLPARKARATLVMGRADPPHTREVLVTLKDEGDSVTVGDMERVKVMSSQLTKVPYGMRPQGPMDENGANVAVTAVADKLNKLLWSAFEGYTIGDDCGDKCIDWSLTFSQALSEEYVRGSYLQFYWYTSAEGDGNYLHAIPLQMLVASKDADLDSWAIVRVWFAGKRFDTVDALLHAWRRDTDGMRSSFFFRFPEADEGRYDSFRKRLGPLRGESQPVGPLSWEPYGKRFKITKGNRVSWLGWSLHVGYLPNHGPRFWDVRFKKERVAYELSMQEAMAVYGSGDLSQANTVFLDSSFGIGYNLRELAQGIDCPMHAAFMDADIFYGGMSGPTTYKNAICVFEHNPDLPALRHYSSAYKFYGAVPGAQLIVRMIATVYNYDYVQDLILGVDGMIDVRVITSGYVQATTWQSGYRNHFGYPLMFNVSGTVHTHVLGWKVDLDIGGTANSVNLLCFESVAGDNGLGGEVLMNRYEAKMCETEEDSGFIAKITEPKIPLVINEGAKNKWGSPRGYKVQLNRPLANLETRGYARSAGLGFWKYNFVATRRREEESHSSSMYNQGDLASPVASLATYVGRDSVRNTDVVVWVNSGLYHVPMAEDAPVTPSTGGNALGFSLAPYNWADESPATDMVDMILVDGNSLDLHNSTEPAVKKVLHKCKPSYTKVPFSTSGFEGITRTDDDVASDAANAGGSGGKRRRGGSGGDGDEDDGDDGGGVSAAAAGARPAQARVRNCRKRGRWVAC